MGSAAPWLFRLRLIELHRLTTFRPAECTFVEDEFPRLDFISGNYLTEGRMIPLKSEQQQEAEAMAYQRTLADERRRQVIGGAPPEAADGDETEVPGTEESGDQEPAQIDGPPSRRTRSSRVNAEPTGLAVWNDPTKLPLLIDTMIGVLSSNTEALEQRDVPENFFESQQGKDADAWKEALNEHM